MNDLVAENSGPTATAGARVIDSGWSFVSDVGSIGSENFDAISLTVNGALAGLDALAFVANPLEEFIKAGVGFVIEHVSFLREPLEMLTGDPNAVTAVSQTWSNIAQELTNAAQAYADNLNLQGWEGDAADKYKNTALNFQGGLVSAADWAQDTSRGIMFAGIVVATVKALVLELICDFVTKAIIKLLTAIASSVVSFGASVAAGIASVVLDATMTASKIAKKLSKLFQAAAKFCQRFKGLGGIMQKLSKGLDEVAEGMAKASREALITGAKAGETMGKVAHNLHVMSATAPDAVARAARGTAFGSTRMGEAALSYPMTGAKGAAGGFNSGQQAQEPEQEQSS